MLCVPPSECSSSGATSEGRDALANNVCSKLGRNDRDVLARTYLLQIPGRGCLSGGFLRLPPPPPTGCSIAARGDGDNVCGRVPQDKIHAQTHSIAATPLYVYIYRSRSRGARGGSISLSGSSAHTTASTSAGVRSLESASRIHTNMCACAQNRRDSLEARSLMSRRASGSSGG